MKKTLIVCAIILLSFPLLSRAQTGGPYTSWINVTQAAWDNTVFYANLLNMKVEDLASFILANFKTAFAQVKWNVAQVSSPQVSISVLRLISGSPLLANQPLTYSLVRVIATSTPNTGVFSWSPIIGDNGTSTYIQVGCVLSNNACQAFSLIPNP